MSHATRAVPRWSACARFLPAAIESVLAQTYPHVELIIADDGSTDKSLDIAQGYASRHPDRVKAFSHDGHANRGISATSNLALRKSSGDYWCGLSSDDTFMPEKVERQVVFLEQHPEIGMVYGRAVSIDAGGRALGVELFRDPPPARDPLPLLLERNWICGSTVMARRECFVTIGLHDEGVMYSDWDLWVRIVARFGMAFLARPLAQYRVHATNSSLGVPPETQLARHLELMEALERKAPAIGGGLARPFARALIELQLAFLFYCAGDRGAAARAFRAAVDIDASMFHSVRFLAGWLIRRRYEMGSFTPAPPDGFLTWFAEQAVPRGASLRSWRPLLAAFLATQNVAARRCGRRVRSLLARIP